MIKAESQVSRKTVNEDRIAICPHFGCKHLEKVKPLKFGFLGFRKYPKCSKHKGPLIFIDEFIGDFLHAVNACLFDFSSLPPETLKDLIKKKIPNELITFIHEWMYCNPIGRGAQIVSQYMDGLSRAYMRLLSWKQRKALKNEKSSKKRYTLLRLGLKKIADEYTTFLQVLREKSEKLYDPKNLHSLSKDMQNLLKRWLKEHLKTIKSTKTTEIRKLSIHDESLLVLKKEYDKILQAGTCALLLGKSPSIVTKTISAFELFSAYHEFLEKGLCKVIKRKDLEVIIEDSQEFLNLNGENRLDSHEDEIKDIFNKSESMNEKYDDLRKEVKNQIKTLIASINSMHNQKEIIWSKSIEILDDFISRVDNNEFSIPKKVNLYKIVVTIIYTVIINYENMPAITEVQLNDMGIKRKNDILKIYNKYFKIYYPRKQFDLSYYQGLKEIRNIISSYIFDLLLENKNKTEELVLKVKNRIIRKNFSEYLTQDQVDLLNEILVNYSDEFDKYLEDLVEVVRLLIIQSSIFKKIGANFIVKPLADYLEKEDVNLFYNSKKFYYSIIDIYDFLRKGFPDFLPPRSSLPKNLSKQEREKIKSQQRDLIGNRIKIYIMKHIYDGKYFIDGSIRCIECCEEGLAKNTDILRLTALEFHHSTKKKEREYSARKLSRLFEKSGHNPSFLEDLINKMESEEVVVLCGVHHHIRHSKYYKYFKNLINWDEVPIKFPQNLFLLPAELIYFLVNISIDNFHLTKNLTLEKKSYIFFTIVSYLKKRYIIESIHGEYCQTCKEFNTKNHLPSFDFHHIKDRHFHENPYVHSNIKTTSGLYVRGAYTCAEIAQILKFEEGGYLCKNCHGVINYSANRLKSLKSIYDNADLVKKALKDFSFVKSQFKCIQNINSVGTPLKKEILITDVLKEYLDAFYEISNKKLFITVPELKKYFKNQRHESTIRRTLQKNKFFRFFTDIVIGKQNLKKYYLTAKGKIYIELIHYFRDYYKNFEFV